MYLFVIIVIIIIIYYFFLEKHAQIKYKTSNVYSSK